MASDLFLLLHPQILCTMAFSKHHLYSPNLQLIGNYAHAFSHAARILIIKQLLTQGPLVVQAIARDHPLHKESVSDHLKILRILNLVEANEKYPYTFYSVHQESLETACIHLTYLVDIIK